MTGGIIDIHLLYHQVNVYAAYAVTRTTSSKEATALIAHYEETSLSHTPSVRLLYARHTPTTAIPPRQKLPFRRVCRSTLRNQFYVPTGSNTTRKLAVRRVSSTGPPSSAEFSRQARQDLGCEYETLSPSYRVESITPIAESHACSAHVNYRQPGVCPSIRLAFARYPLRPRSAQETNRNHDVGAPLGGFCLAVHSSQAVEQQHGCSGPARINASVLTNEHQRHQCEEKDYGKHMHSIHLLQSQITTEIECGYVVCIRTATCMWKSIGFHPAWHTHAAKGFLCVIANEEFRNYLS